MSQHNGITPPARPLVSFAPMNMQEHENDIRAIVNTHMGPGSGNPTGWVIKAGLECFSRGFGEGFAAAQAQRPMATQQDAREQRQRLNAEPALRDGEVIDSGLKLEFAAPPPSLMDRLNAKAGDELGGWLEDSIARNADCAKWLAFFTAALSGTAASAGSADNVINFAREIADAALQAWRER